MSECLPMIASHIPAMLNVERWTWRKYQRLRRRAKAARRNHWVACPRCFARTGFGYGFAFGGGLGHYAYCTGRCGWHDKAVDCE